MISQNQYCWLVSIFKTPKTARNTRKVPNVHPPLLKEVCLNQWQICSWLTNRPFNKVNTWQMWPVKSKQQINTSNRNAQTQIDWECRPDLHLKQFLNVRVKRCSTRHIKSSRRTKSSPKAGLWSTKRTVIQRKSTQDSATTYLTGVKSTPSVLRKAGLAKSS